MHLSFYSRIYSYFTFTKVSDIQSFNGCYSPHTYIMYVRYDSPGVKVNDYVSLSITLWSVYGFRSCRSQWKLLSHNLSCSIFSNCKLCSNRFDRSPCAFNTFYIQTPVIMSSFFSDICMVKLYPYYTRRSISVM